MYCRECFLRNGRIHQFHTFWCVTFGWVARCVFPFVKYLIRVLTNGKVRFLPFYHLPQKCGKSWQMEEQGCLEWQAAYSDNFVSYQIAFLKSTVKCCHCTQLKPDVLPILHCLSPLLPLGCCNTSYERVRSFHLTQFHKYMHSSCWQFTVSRAPALSCLDKTEGLLNFKREGKQPHERGDASLAQILILKPPPNWIAWAPMMENEEMGSHTSISLQNQPNYCLEIRM